MCLLPGQDWVSRFCLGSRWPEDGWVKDTDYPGMANSTLSKGHTVLLRIHKLLQTLYQQLHWSDLATHPPNPKEWTLDLDNRLPSSIRQPQRSIYYSAHTGTLGSQVTNDPGDWYLWPRPGSYPFHPIQQWGLPNCLSLKSLQCSRN